MVEAIIKKYKWERPREAMPPHETVKWDFKKILVAPHALFVSSQKTSAPAFLFTYTKHTIEHEINSNRCLWTNL